MSQPTVYNRNTNFVEYALANSAVPYNPADHDAEFDDVEVTLDALCLNLAMIQRDDGQLGNGTVGADQISSELLAMFATPVVFRGAWVTLTVYAVNDIVEQSGNRYVCLVAHTAGTFSTDLAAGKWQALGLSLPITAGSVTAAPAGNLGGVTVQAQLYELDAEKAALGGSAAQTFSVADASDDQHALSRRQYQKGALLLATGGGTADAITATLATAGVVALSDGLRVLVPSPGTNSIAAPTLNLTLDATATGAITVVRGDTLAALHVGDIGPGVLDFMYRSGINRWLLMNPAMSAQEVVSLELQSAMQLALAAFAR